MLFRVYWTTYLSSLPKAIQETTNVQCATNYRQLLPNCCSLGAGHFILRSRSMALLKHDDSPVRTDIIERVLYLIRQEQPPGAPFLEGYYLQPGAEKLSTGIMSILVGCFKESNILTFSVFVKESNILTFFVFVKEPSILTFFVFVSQAS